MSMQLFCLLGFLPSKHLCKKLLTKPIVQCDKRMNEFCVTNTPHCTIGLVSNFLHKCLHGRKPNKQKSCIDICYLLYNSQN